MNSKKPIYLLKNIENKIFKTNYYYYGKPYFRGTKTS